MNKFNLHEKIIRLQDKTLDFNELDIHSLTLRDIDIKLNGLSFTILYYKIKKK